MKTKRQRKKISIDDIQFYAARSAYLHPLLYNQFLDEIIKLENNNKVCALPITIFDRYHLYLEKKHKKAA